MTEDSAPRPSPPKRPPPVPRRNAPNPSVSEAQQRAISSEALGLLTEQINARIVHYRADLDTNSELDAITAQVVAQVRALQEEASTTAGGKKPPALIALELSQALSGLLQRLLSPQDGKADFLSRWLSPVGKRVARLFFESELHERTQQNKERVIRSSAQGVYYALTRYANRLRADLEGFDYQDEDTKTGTILRLERIVVELRTEFLSRRSPELQRVMAILTETLTVFLTEEIGRESALLSESVIAKSCVSELPSSVGYKVIRDGFPLFRQAWEKEWIERWVRFASPRFVAALNVADEPFLEETIAFFTDPHLYSDTAVVLCEAVYDYLCQEGFLDLPLDWRVQMRVRL